MDTVLAKRNLANQKDTAQSHVDAEISYLVGSARETEFVVPMLPLYGEVNLSALSRLNVKSIVSKEPGGITEIRGIPDSISNLRIDHQLLVEIRGLPKSLEMLNLDANYIESIDLSNLNRLKVLRICNNRIKRLGKLPASLEEIYVDNNQLSYINLENLEKLRVLHCRRNRTLRIDNIPASIVDLAVEDGNPQIILDYAFIPDTASASSESEREARGTEAEFVDALHRYFKLKSKYEEGARNARMAAREAALKRGLGETRARKYAAALRPKCVNCKRQVGTIFKMRENRLLAYCADVNAPCALRIEIFKGNYESSDAFAETTRDVLLETKEQIIQQKMNVLFNYASEEETVAKFKELIEDYNANSFLHKTDSDAREDKRFNAHKRELIKVKQSRIVELKRTMNMYMDEYAESDNRDSLHAAMDVYVREYLPEIHNLRMMKYSVMEMIIPDMQSGVRILNQSSASMRELEKLDGEIPRVLKFTVGQDTGPVAPLAEKEGPAEIESDAEENNTIPFSSYESEFEPESESESEYQ
jgi:hypothetical protein